jgi:hypothetical protein
MLKRLAAIICAVVLCSSVATAQEAAAQRQPEPPQPVRSGTAQLVNIRIELTIIDQRGDTTSPPKTVTMLVEDRQNARIRSSRGNATLNVDGHPEILREGKIRVMLSIEYSPQDGPDRASPLPIQESVTALLEDGKPLVVSQSADPSGDRKVRLELKATIVK